jgi:hypothetical protein
MLFMMKFCALRRLITLTVGFAATLNLAVATEVDYTYSGETGGGLVMGLNADGDTGSFLVGQVIMTTSTPGWSTLNSYCTDVGVEMASSSLYTPISITSPQATGVNPKWLAGGGVAAATLWANYSATVNGVTQMAGLQLAIWELLNNHQSSYTANNFYSSQNGGFYVTSTDANSEAAVGFAVSILGNLNSLTPEQNVDWLAPIDANGSIGGSQGLLDQGPSSNNVPVPETAPTLMLLSLALFALGLLKLHSTLISSIRAKRKPAYLRTTRYLPSQHARN